MVLPIYPQIRVILSDWNKIQMIAFGLLMDFALVLFPCFITCLIDYFSPPRLRLSRICRILLIFSKVLSETLEEKMMFMHKSWHFQPHMFEGLKELKRV